MVFVEKTEEEFEKEMMEWHITVYQKIKEKDEQKEKSVYKEREDKKNGKYIKKKEKYEEKTEEKRSICSVASFFCGTTHSCCSEEYKKRTIGPVGFNSEDYKVLSSMRNDDPNMFDRMAVK